MKTNQPTRTPSVSIPWTPSSGPAGSAADARRWLAAGAAFALRRPNLEGGPRGWADGQLPRKRKRRPAAEWRRGPSARGRHLKPRRGEAPRAGENLSVFPLVLNLKPQKCAVWLGRVKSHPDSTGDPSSFRGVHGSLPHSASLSLPLPASQSKTGVLSLHFLLGPSFWALPNRSMPCCDLRRV